MIGTDEVTSQISFKKLLFLTLIIHVAVLVPACIVVLLLRLLDIEPLLFIICILVILPVPLSAALAWLMAKGSNWQNIRGAVTTSWALPFRYSALLLGGFLGFRYLHNLGLWGGIITGAVFYIGAHLTYLHFSKRLTDKLIPFVLKGN